MNRKFYSQKLQEILKISEERSTKLVDYLEKVNRRGCTDERQGDVIFLGNILKQVRNGGCGATLIKSGTQIKFLIVGVEISSSKEKIRLQVLSQAVGEEEEEKILPMYNNGPRWFIDGQEIKGK